MPIESVEIVRCPTQLLAESVVVALDETSIGMAQLFLSAPSPETVDVLRHIGFRHIADLLYMTCESPEFPLAAPDSGGMEYVAYHPSQRNQLKNLVEQT